MKNFILNRIKEPSTWAALTAMGAFFGVPPGVPELVHQIAIGVCGLIAVFAPEATQ